VDNDAWVRCLDAISDVKADANLNELEDYGRVVDAVTEQANALQIPAQGVHVEQLVDPKKVNQFDFLMNSMNDSSLGDEIIQDDTNEATAVD